MKKFMACLVVLFLVSSGCMTPAGKRRLETEVRKGEEIAIKIMELEAIVEDAYKKVKSKEMTPIEAAVIASEVAAELPSLVAESKETLTEIKKIREEEQVSWLEIVGGILGTVGASVLATYVHRGKIDRVKDYSK